MLVVKHHSSCRKIRFGGLGYQWLPELVTTKVLKVIVVSNDGEHAETLDCHLTLVSEQTRPRIKDFLKRSSEYHNFLELTLKKKMIAAMGARADGQINKDLFSPKNSFEIIKAKIR